MDNVNSSSLAKLELSQVTFGIFTALDTEFLACRMIFDPEKQGIEVSRLSTSGILNCWLCYVNSKHRGQHVVAISLLPGMGNVSAAIGANIVRQYCPKLHYMIMCGIAGAVPHPEEPKHHVRLGDIVVSDEHGVIAYDRGKQRDPKKALLQRDTLRKEIVKLVDGGAVSADAVEQLIDRALLFHSPLLGFELRARALAPSSNLLQIIRHIHKDEAELRADELRPWEKRIAEVVPLSKNPDKWKRPEHDTLDDSPEGCGHEISHPKDFERRENHPRVFHGPIGAANIVLANPNLRNELRVRWQIKAVEMEGWGIADASWMAGLGYLVVRGTCDYCNSTKNDDWHNYASIVAAAYCRTVVESTPLVEEFASQFRQQDASVSAEEKVLSVLVQPSGYDITLPTSDTPPEAERSQNNNRMTIQPPHGILSPLAQPEQLPVIQERIQSTNQQTPDEIITLTTTIRQMIRSGQLAESVAPLARLEQLLRQLPRKGKSVREGWLTLAEVEESQQMRNRQHGSRDLSRFAELIQEATLVTD